MNFKLVFLIALIGFMIGLGSMAVIAKPVTQPPPNEMRAQVINRIDRLAGFNVREINDQTKGGDTYDTYDPNPPQKFLSDKYKVLFQKGNRRQYLFFDTEGDIGHHKEVIPGTTMINGSIMLMDGPQENFFTGPKGVVLTAAEQDYFIRMLYKDFRFSMVKEDAQRLNQVKDYALAIYFNGLSGMDDYHEQQKLIAELGQGSPQ